MSKIKRQFWELKILFIFSRSDIFGQGDLPKWGPKDPSQQQQAQNANQNIQKPNPPITQQQKDDDETRDDDRAANRRLNQVSQITF